MELERSSHRRSQTLGVWLGTVTLLLVPSYFQNAQAADNASLAARTKVATAAVKSQPAHTARGIRAANASAPNAQAEHPQPLASLGDEVAKLKSRLSKQDEILSKQQKQIERLTALLEQQMKLLGAKVDHMEPAPASAPESAPELASLPTAGVSASLAPVVVMRAAPPAPVSAPLSAPAPAPAAFVPVASSQEFQGLSQKVDGLSKSVDALSKGLAGFKLSGTFLVRGDGIFRSANEVSSAQQNARGRYQLRLNVDRQMNDKLGFHVQLGSGTFNNPLTAYSDFTGVDAHGPFLLLEAWGDYHPNSNWDFKLGKLPESFFDDSRYLFDEDARFNGGNESYRVSVGDNPLGITSFEARAGQYVLTNPNLQLPSLAACKGSNPPASCVFIDTTDPSNGFTPGSRARDADLFDEGVVLTGKLAAGWTHHLLANYEYYRNAQEMQIALTTNGSALLIGSGLGVTLSGVPPATGNATTTKGGAFLNAGGFQIAHLGYGLDYRGWTLMGRQMPLHLDFHGSRNTVTSLEPWGFAGILTLGQTERYGDTTFQYGFYYKAANSMPAGVTDDQVGTNTNVNVRTHMFRFGYTLNKYLVWQNRLYIQNEISGNDPSLNFYVPVPKGTATQYRAQTDLLFRF